MTFRRMFLIAALVLLTSGVSVAQLDSPQTSTKDEQAVSGMVLIPSGHFWMGRARLYLGEEIGWLARDRTDDRPLHLVDLNAFYMDIHEVTNSQFEEFVNSTGYITLAERDINWEEMKKSVPVGTTKPPDELLAAGSVAFKGTNLPVSLHDERKWWEWRIGANWKHPNGPESNIKNNTATIILT